MWIPCSLGPCSVLAAIRTSETPPETSDPIEIPRPCQNTLLRTVMFWDGMAKARPAALKPDLMAMWSSPQPITLFSIKTSRLESGSMPSVLGESSGAVMVTS